MLTNKRNKSYTKITVWLIALVGGFASSYGLLTVISPMFNSAQSAVKGDSITVGMQKPQEDKQIASFQSHKQRSDNYWKTTQASQTSSSHTAAVPPSTAPVPIQEATPAPTPASEEQSGLLGDIVDGVTSVLPTIPSI